MSDMRSQLLEVAGELFAERGYEAVSMRDIARLVGVSQANLYYHFKGKADLIEATLAYVFGARANDLQTYLAQHSRDPLEAFVRWLVGALKADRIFARLLYRELLDGDADRIETLSRTVLQGPFRALVAAVPARACGSAEAAALSLVGLILGEVLVMPLALGLIGRGASDELEAVLAQRLIDLVRPWIAEA